MGSDLYLSVSVRHPSTPYRNPDYWGSLFDGPSCALAKGIVVDAFGTSEQAEEEREHGGNLGYLAGSEIKARAEHPECPWRLDEPYWVRCIVGADFVAVIREKRWQRLQDGDFRDTECMPELRAMAAMVESLLGEGLDVRVWCWHSQ